jgi:hypothetical protein
MTMIKPSGGKFLLYTSDGKRVLGVHKSKADALAQERAIKASEARRGKK